MMTYDTSYAFVIPIFAMILYMISWPLALVYMTSWFMWQNYAADVQGMAFYYFLVFLTFGVFARLSGIVSVHKTDMEDD